MKNKPVKEILGKRTFLEPAKEKEKKKIEDLKRRAEKEKSMLEADEKRLVKKKGKLMKLTQLTTVKFLGLKN